jgi:transposase
MNQSTLDVKDTATQRTLYMALELSKASWKVGFAYQGKARNVTVEGGNVAQLAEEISKAKVKFALPADVRICSCYEAGRDGFWLHRWLTGQGVNNMVVDPASIEVSRQARRAKTDNVDREMLLSKLRQHHGGERVWKEVRVPDEAAEAGRILHRELERLKKERSSLNNQIKGRLFAQGVRLESVRAESLSERVERMRTGDGRPLAGDLLAELRRSGKRLALLEQQIGEMERERDRRLSTETEAGSPEEKAQHLMRLKAIGPVAAWLFTMEFFGWRRFRNAKEVGALAGLTGTPYDSGDSRREQGISKAGNRRVRALAVEIAWMWLRYQPESALSRWFHERFGGNKRSRRVGIVALARKLLVALWRYLETGQLPDGAQLKAG